ncbi:MAG: hypothetical protein M5R41_07885 [Bacteroidia bacterium]|nr:hypothetical protein [Bacteroidia bacterium]
MTLHRLLHIFTGLTLFAVAAVAQTGTWRTLTDMKNVRDIAVSNGRVIAATSGGVFVSVGTDFTRFTNVDGLSDIDYTAVTTLPDGRLVAGASTGFLNIRSSGGEWSEVSDIVRATQFQRRGITCLYEHAGKLYVGTEFGLTVYDPDRREFGDTYTKFGNLPSQGRVNDVLVLGNDIWVATEHGIAAADLRHPNLKDPTNWTSYTSFPGGGSPEVHSLAIRNDALHATTAAAILRFESGAFALHVGALGAGAHRRIRVHGVDLYLVTEVAVFRVDSGGNAIQVGDRLDNGSYPVNPRFTDLASNGSDIVVASTDGISIHVQGNAWSFARPDGPASNFFKALTVDDFGVLWAASGLSDKGIYAYDGTRWMNYDSKSVSQISSNTVMDLTDGPDGSVWFATRGGGVLERKADGTFVNHTVGTVPDFPGLDDNPLFPAVEGIKRDNRGNVWSLHFRSGGGLLGCRTPDGSWRFYSDPSLPKGTIVSGLAVDQSGRKWIMMNTSNFRGLLVFDDKGTLATTSDDTWTRFNANDASGINAENEVTSVAVDMLGDVWIGTDRGLRTIFNPRVNDRVSKTCFNTRCNIEGLYISAIAIDPVNNKWLGTKDGVFVLTPDGSEILAQYNTDNSPLLDNDIINILVHPQTGVAYIATRRGLSSLATPYVEPVVTFGDVTVAPNPFRPAVDGQLSIDGLVEGSIIKILSVSGDLVAEVPSPGGRIGFWDGRTLTGEAAASGMYFVVAAAANGKQAGVAKVAVIKD